MSYTIEFSKDSTFTEKLVIENEYILTEVLDRKGIHITHSTDFGVIHDYIVNELYLRMNEIYTHPSIALGLLYDYDVIRQPDFESEYNNEEAIRFINNFKVLVEYLKSQGAKYLFYKFY